MAEEATRLHMRISTELRDQLAADAAQNCRTLNGHIVFTLRESVRREEAQREAAKTYLARRAERDQRDQAVRS